MSLKVDFTFISELEGGQQLTAYVPASSISQSGVTIATGFDLGARDEHDLQKLGFSTDLISRLKPYLGLKKAEAVAKLEHDPLSISQPEADLIDAAAKADATEFIVNLYDSAIASGALPFAELSAEAQTVIASVSYQYGNLSVRTPMFWAAVTAQDWHKSINILKDFHDNYPTRRHKEAAYLQAAASN